MADPKATRSTFFGAAVTTVVPADLAHSRGPVAVVAVAIDFRAVIVQGTASLRSKPSTSARIPSAGRQERAIAFVGVGSNS